MQSNESMVCQKKVRLQSQQLSQIGDLGTYIHWITNICYLIIRVSEQKWHFSVLNLVALSMNLLHQNPRNLSK
jgi:hypothetical protein